jgi:ribosomal protein S18 acetylase RimI-like enzyme
MTEIREVRPEEMDALRGMLSHIDAFRPEEMECAAEIALEFLGGDRDYHPFILWDGGAPAGYLCFGKVPLTRATYDLYWIAVSPESRRKGHGQRLMAFFLDAVRREGGDLAVIETSSLPAYEAGRALYIRCGFREAARIPGYYGPGDDLVIYTLPLGEEP